MWLEKMLPKRQPEYLVAIETLVLVTLDVGKGQVRADSSISQ
jgi:hypothetical protein